MQFKDQSVALPRSVGHFRVSARTTQSSACQVTIPSHHPVFASPRRYENFEEFSYFLPGAKHCWQWYIQQVVQGEVAGEMVSFITNKDAVVRRNAEVWRRRKWLRNLVRGVEEV